MDIKGYAFVTGGGEDSFRAYGTGPPSHTVLAYV